MQRTVSFYSAYTHITQGASFLQNPALPWNDFNSWWVFPPGGASSKGLWLFSSLRLTSAPNSNNSDTCSAQSCLTAACRGLSHPLPEFTLAPGSKNSTIFRKQLGDICLQADIANETLACTQQDLWAGCLSVQTADVERRAQVRRFIACISSMRQQGLHTHATACTQTHTV